MINALTPEKAREAENERREFLLGALKTEGTGEGDNVIDDGQIEELALSADQFIITPAESP
jgi:hypothetical protein